MKTYYFLKINGIKTGPIQFSELQKHKLKPDTLVWRNDVDHWKSAKEFEELEEFIFFDPPQTPFEIKTKDFIGKIKKELPKMILVIIFFSIIIGVFTSYIAQNSWKSFKTEIESQRKKNEEALGDEAFFKGNERSLISRSPASGERYPDDYIFGEDNELRYSKKQIFIFRPFYSIHSNIYLTEEERDNQILLIFYLSLSSLAFLSLFMTVIYLFRFFNFVIK